MSLTVILIVAGVLSISLPLSSSGPLWPDGQWYVFNGILIHDMIRDGAVFSPYAYNVTFYAQYPATNLPYGPPFFAVVNAIAFSLFGISFSVSRYVVAFYTVCASLMCWFMVYRIYEDYWLSVIAVAVFLFNPFTLANSRDITPELPVAFYSFLTVYFYYYYVEYGRKRFGLLAAISLSLGYLTKPYIIPLGASLFIYILIFKKWSVLRKSETWVGIMIAIILIVPYTILSLSFTTEYLVHPAPIAWDLMAVYPVIFIGHAPFITVFAVFGFFIGLIKKDKLILLSLIWAVCWYLFFTFYIRNTNGEKYLATFIPAMIAPSAIVLHGMVSRIKSVHLKRVVIISIAIGFLYRASQTPFYYVYGYETAAEYVANNRKGKSVLFYGSYDGSFMLGIRKRSPMGGIIVLRGDRQLATRLWWGELKDNSTIRTGQEIIDLLNKYQTGYVVVENEMPLAKNYSEYLILNKTLKSKEHFREIERFPIETNYRKLGTELIIYEFNRDPEADEAIIITFPVPTLEREIKVAF